MNCRIALCAALALAFLVAGVTVTAQGADPVACPALAAQALQLASDSCAGLGRDTACYGHSLVNATFREGQTGLVFAAPADRVALADLRALTTAPLDRQAQIWGVALLHVQADLPETLPGQAVMLLLMGDATLEDAAAPGAAPLQALYLRTGLGVPECAETPNALVIQSPAGTPVTMTINDLAVQLSSTAIFTLAEAPTEDGAAEVMVITLLEGHLNTAVAAGSVALEQPDAAEPIALPAIAVTLNDRGRVDETSTLVAPPVAAVAATVTNACLDASLAGIEALSAAGCAAPLAPYTPPLPEAAGEVAITAEAPAEDTAPTERLFDVGTCEAGRDRVEGIHSGDRVTIMQGCRWPTEAEALASAAAANGYIIIDGVSAPVQHGWIRWLEAEPAYDIPAGWEVSVRTVWTATAGGHTAIGNMPPCGPHACVFTVSDE
ncbi:MAG: hypothetical protein HPY64_06190 [Anaerolineae bacterium]|nr:hypothetical protein [Anaerolineae bacterium]